MKNKFYLSIVLLVALVLENGCTKEAPPGTDGTANVQSNTITFSTWKWDSTNGFAYADFKWAAITPSIENSGTVLLYVQTPTGWAPLPRSIFPNATYSQSQRYTYSNGTFKIIVQDSDLSQPVSLGTWTIKAVSIESCVKKANPHLNWNNYYEVKNAFHLRD